MRLERLVVGIDFSAHSIDAAQWVASRFAPGVELVLAHVISIPAPSSRGRTSPLRGNSLIDPLREAAEKQLREIRLSPKPEFVWREIREGDPVEWLTRVAQEFSADAIVVGAYGERSGPRGSLGTTAEQLLRVSVCPVLLAPHARLTPPPDGVGPADTPRNAAGTLPWALDLPRPMVPTRSSAR